VAQTLLSVLGGAAAHLVSATPLCTSRVASGSSRLRAKSSKVLRAKFSDLRIAVPSRTFGDSSLDCRVDPRDQLEEIGPVQIVRTSQQPLRCGFYVVSQPIVGQVENGGLRAAGQPVGAKLHELLEKVLPLLSGQSWQELERERRVTRVRQRRFNERRNLGPERRVKTHSLGDVGVKRRLDAPECFDGRFRMFSATHQRSLIPKYALAIDERTQPIEESRLRVLRASA